MPVPFPFSVDWLHTVVQLEFDNLIITVAYCKSSWVVNQVTFH